MAFEAENAPSLTKVLAAVRGTHKITEKWPPNTKNSSSEEHQVAVDVGPLLRKLRAGWAHAKQEDPMLPSHTESTGSGSSNDRNSSNNVRAGFNSLPKGGGSSDSSPAHPVVSVLLAQARAKLLSQRVTDTIRELDQVQPKKADTKIAMSMWCKRRAASLGASELASKVAAQEAILQNYTPDTVMALEAARLHYQTCGGRLHMEPGSMYDGGAVDIMAARKAALGAALRSAKLRALAETMLAMPGPVTIAGMDACLDVGAHPGAEYVPQLGTCTEGIPPHQASQTASMSPFTQPPASSLWPLQSSMPAPPSLRCNGQQHMVEPEHLMPATLLALASVPPVEEAPLSPNRLTPPGQSLGGSFTDAGVPTPVEYDRQGSTGRGSGAGAGSMAPTSRAASGGGAGLKVQPISRVNKPTSPAIAVLPPSPGKADAGTGSGGTTSRESYSADFENVEGSGESSGPDGSNGVGWGAGRAAAVVARKMGGGISASGEEEEEEYSEDFEEEEEEGSSSVSTVSTDTSALHHWGDGDGSESGSEARGGGFSLVRHNTSRLRPKEAAVAARAVTAAAALVGTDTDAGGDTGAPVAAAGHPRPGREAPAAPSSGQGALRVQVEGVGDGDDDSDPMWWELGRLDVEVVRARVGAMLAGASPEVRGRWDRQRVDESAVRDMLAAGAALRRAAEALLGSSGGGEDDGGGEGGAVDGGGGGFVDGGEDGVVDGGADGVVDGGEDGEVTAGTVDGSVDGSGGDEGGGDSLRHLHHDGVREVSEQVDEGLLQVASFRDMVTTMVIMQR